MKPIEQVTACVIDHGLFPHIAQCLESQCKQVFYTGPNERVMRLLEDDLLGDGMAGIRRVESVWEVDQICDVFVFPDTGFHWEQQKLLREGRAVFGHHGCDILETYKGRFLDVLKELEMEVPPHIVITGMDALMEFLTPVKDKFVKVSKWRGDWETFHWRSAQLDLDELRGHKFNRCPMRDDFIFYVFDKIDTKIEDGIDTFCIDGQWPKKVLHAMECKDKSLLGGMQEMSAIDESIRMVNDNFGPWLGKRGYRGPFSTEVRPPYFIDPTLRFGSPPSQLQTVIIKNLPEIIYRGALGTVIEPEYEDVLGAQVLITADKEKDQYLTVPMPDELRPFVKSSFCFEKDGVMRIAPNPLENWVGWLVATGSTIREVVETLKERKEMLPSGFDCDITSLAHLLDELEEAQKQDIQITEQRLPTPEIVL